MSNKWNDETEATLESEVALVGGSPVSQEALKQIAESMSGAVEFTARSIGSKLRKMGYEVQLASEKVSMFNPAQEDDIRAFLSANCKTHTYAEIANLVCGGQFSAKAIQGKILSMELTDSVKPTPKKESVKTYTDEEEAIVLAGCKAGDFLEDIAKSVGKSDASVRGKALSLLKSGQISALPVQKHKKAAASDPFEGINTEELTVEQISEKIGKTIRGTKVMLTNRKLSASDYVFKEKAE